MCSPASPSPARRKSLYRWLEVLEYFSLAQYVVWRHRNQEETSTQVCTKIEFCKMMATVRSIMKKKLCRRGRLSRGGLARCY